MNTPAVSYNSRSIGERDRFVYAIGTIWWLVGFLTGTAASLLAPPARSPRLRFVRQQATGALTYAVIMLCVGTAIIAFLVACVVPQIATIFEQQHAVLPASTTFLIAFCGFVIRMWPALAIALLTLLLGITAALATPGGRRLYDCYNRQHADSNKWIEPLVTTAMAAVIVFMMLAVLMPIFQLNQLMQ